MITTRRTIEVAVLCAAPLLAALIFHAWLAAAPPTRAQKVQF
jgi:hypothetical protein